MIVKLLNEHHLEFLSLKGGCRSSSESTLVKMPHCWKSHATANLLCREKTSDHVMYCMIKTNVYLPAHERNLPTFHCMNIKNK